MSLETFTFIPFYLWKFYVADCDNCSFNPLTVICRIGLGCVHLSWKCHKSLAKVLIFSPLFEKWQVSLVISTSLVTLMKQCRFSSSAVHGQAWQEREGKERRDYGARASARSIRIGSWQHGIRNSVFSFDSFFNRFLNGCLLIIPGRDLALQSHCRMVREVLLNTELVAVCITWRYYC